MALAWVRVDKTLQRHPKTIALAQALGCSRLEAEALFVNLLCFATDYAPEGKLEKFGSSYLSEMCGWRTDADDFLDELIAVGFVEAKGLTIHGWDQFQGRAIAESDRGRARAAEWRKDKSTGEASERTRTEPVERTRTEPVERTRTEPVERTPLRARADGTGRDGTERNEREEGVALAPPPSLILSSLESEIDSAFEAIIRKKYNRGNLPAVVVQWGADFPGVDLASEARAFATWVNANRANKVVVPLSRFRNWLVRVPKVVGSSNGDTLNGGASEWIAPTLDDQLAGIKKIP